MFHIGSWSCKVPGLVGLDKEEVSAGKPNAICRTALWDHLPDPSPVPWGISPHPRSHIKKPQSPMTDRPIFAVEIARGYALSPDESVASGGGRMWTEQRSEAKALWGEAIRRKFRPEHQGIRYTQRLSPHTSGGGER